MNPREQMVGLIRHQEEIYVTTEREEYINLTTCPQSECEQKIQLHASRVDSLIELLLAAKARTGKSPA